MIDDSGFKHVRLKVVAPGMKESAALLNRLYGNPDVSTTLSRAWVVDGQPFFELDIFGATSQVDEVLASGSMAAEKEPEPTPQHLEAHV